MRLLALGSAVLSMATGPAVAQEVSVFAGGLHARYADSISGTAGTMAVRLQGFGRHAAGSLEGAVSQFASGEWAAQVGGQATAVAVVSPRVGVGLSAGGVAHTFEGGDWSGVGAGGPLLVVGGPRLLLTLGGSVGGGRRVDGRDFAAGTGSLRLRYDPGSGVSVALGGVATGSDTLTFADGSVQVGYRSDRLAVTGSLGARIGELSDDPWAELQVEVMPTRWSALELAGGRYPRDLTGFTSGAYLSGGVRLYLRGPARRTPRRAPGDAVRVAPVSPDRVVVSLRFAPHAERLAIAGDWNDWTAVAMRREGRGRWTVELPLAPGVYRYALLVDGRAWAVPDGVPSLPDDFGGRVGVLVVP